MLRDMFKKTYTLIDTKYRSQNSQEPNIPEGLWRKCRKCGQPVLVEDVRNNFYICPKCKAYFRMHAYRRIEITADEGSFEEWNPQMDCPDPLEFPGYPEKVREIQEKTGLREAVVTGKCRIGGEEAALAVCDARFLMGSMGRVVGEKITSMVERAVQEKLPVVIFACSGGARMQEGMVSLMQMAKTSAALKRHHEAGLLYISVLTDPTTGGVTASFAMLGDIILAEPKALIGFAGPRVIQQTIGQKLPEGFQRAEFLQEHGFVDRIVKREEMKETLAQILKLHAGAQAEEEGRTPEEERRMPEEERQMPEEEGRTPEEERQMPEKERRMPEKVRRMPEEEWRMPEEWAQEESVTPWQRVQLSRSTERPVALDYINALFDHFIELHGDRCYGDDGAVIGGIAEFHGIPVTVIGQQKGRTTKENIKCNFGMPSPEGYRKALRLIRQAEHFHRPVICFVDTPGAFCGIEAEERGQGEAIARNLFELSDLKVPVLSIVIGEGGSGGALAMAVANEVWMMENSIYSILSPEGFASILWKDSKRADEAAGVMKITAGDLLKLHVIDQVIREKEPVCAEYFPEVTADLKLRIEKFIRQYKNKTPLQLQQQRYERYRRF